jgi:hypothetical protein
MKNSNAIGGAFKDSRGPVTSRIRRTAADMELADKYMAAIVRAHYHALHFRVYPSAPSQSVTRFTALEATFEKCDIVHK